MRLIRLVLAVMLLLCAAGQTTFATVAAVEADFYVAVDGNDDWSGRLAAPADDGADGPFATIDRARLAVREQRGEQPDRRTPILVLIRGGMYQLDKPIIFTPEDSGTQNAPVIYRAYPDEQPVLSGGRVISDWQVMEDGTWQTTLEPVRTGQWHFAQLWANDQRRFRPRLPREGYFTVERQVEASEEHRDHGHDRFGYRQGDVDPNWHQRDDVELLMFHIWSASRMRIAELDSEQRIIRFAGRSRSTNHWGQFRQNARYMAINVKEALGDPGQWYLDRSTGELTYIPKEHETPANTTIIAPRLETLLHFEADLPSRRWVEHIHLEGLTLAHSNWTLPATGQSSPQAEIHMSAAVQLVGGRQIHLRHCALRHLGGYGIGIWAGSRDNVIEHTDIIDMGAGGVKIGLGGGQASWAVGPQEHRVDWSDGDMRVYGNVVRHCTLAYGGRLHPAAVGVWIGHASHNTIKHCDIFDFYYSAVSVGWTWGYATPSRSHHNEIAYNHMHTIGQGVLSDMAGVYTLGIAPGTRVHHNIIHDVDAYDYGGWGLYTDEGSTDVIMDRNLVYRTKTGGFHQHYGRENRIENNILANAAVQQLQRTRTEDHVSFYLKRNIIWWNNDSPLMGSNWRDDNFVTDDNLYWRDGGAVTFPGNLTLEQWREQRGKDRNSLIADPRFADPLNDDFTLPDDSPAIDLGFERFDLSTTGRQSDAATLKHLPTPPRAYE